MKGAVKWVLVLGIVDALIVTSGARAESFFVAGRNLAGRIDVVRQSGVSRAWLTLQRFGKNASTTQRDIGRLAPDGSLRTWAGTCALRYGSPCVLGGENVRVWAAPDTSHLVIIAVPGLSTNQWNRIGVPYFDENIAAMRAMGISAYRIGVKTENGIDTNAAQIAGDIRARAAEHRRVILFAHSKGAADALAALAKDPSLAQHVHGVIAVQPVFGGSPIADFIAKQRLLSPAVKLVFERAFGGQTSAVTDLSAQNRSSFHAKWPYPSSLRTVVIRSTFNRPLSKSLLWPNQKLITKFTGAPNDGMVKLADQSVPGAAATLDYADLDHFEPGLRNESPHTPVDLTTRSLLVLFGLAR
jgi:pimeloyl-ACP methyl ester carboxylesterase